MLFLLQILKKKKKRLSWNLDSEVCSNDLDVIIKLPYGICIHIAEFCSLFIHMEEETEYMTWENKLREQNIFSDYFIFFQILNFMGC